MIPYQYTGWTLYEKEAELEPGKNQTVYFFSKVKPKSGKPTGDLPTGRKVLVNKKSMKPLLTFACPLCGGGAFSFHHVTRQTEYVCLEGGDCEWSSSLFDDEDITAFLCEEEECEVCHPDQR